MHVRTIYPPPQPHSVQGLVQCADFMSDFGKSALGARRRPGGGAGRRAGGRGVEIGNEIGNLIGCLRMFYFFFNLVAVV